MQNIVTVWKSEVHVLEQGTVIVKRAAVDGKRLPTETSLAPLRRIRIVFFCFQSAQLQQRLRR
jgi:hypothetical protein